jgi:Flp pilus assembly protein TadD
MTRRLLPALIVATLALSAYAADEAETADNPDSTSSAVLPKQDLTPRILYELVLAEIAGARGQLGLAAEAYLDLARTTRDPRVARRAAEVALYARRYDMALEAARLWSDIEPNSPQPHQMVIGLLAATGRTDDLVADLAQQFAGAGKQTGDQLMELNRLLARYPDKQAARRLVDKLTEPYLSMAEAHFARAQAAHAAGDEAGAAADLDRAIALRPNWEQAVLARAQMTTDGAETARVLSAFVAANPKAKDARLAYARSLVAEKRYTEARREFQTLLADHNDNGDVVYAVAVLSLQLNDMDEAETQLKRLVGMQHNESDSARVYLGQIAEERKRFDEALKWYGEVGTGSQYVPARMRMAHVFVRQEKLDEARRTLQETTAASPSERAQLLIAESQLLRDAGRNDDAYAVLVDGLAAHPDQPELLYEAGLLAERVGNFEVGEADLRRLIKLKPDYAHAYNALGYSLADRNQHLDEAQQLIDKALELAPDDPFILDSKGWVLFRRGDAIGAVDVLTKAFKLRADPEIAAHLGEVLWTLGRQDEARVTWGDAMKASPGNEVLVGTVKKFTP